MHSHSLSWRGQTYRLLCPSGFKATFTAATEVVALKLDNISNSNTQAFLIFCGLSVRCTLFAYLSSTGALPTGILDNDDQMLGTKLDVSSGHDCEFTMNSVTHILSVHMGLAAILI